MDKFDAVAYVTVPVLFSRAYTDLARLRLVLSGIKLKLIPIRTIFNVSARDNLRNFPRVPIAYTRAQLIQPIT